MNWHDNKRASCPINDPETYANPATSGLGCDCKQPTQAEITGRLLVALPFIYPSLPTFDSHRDGSVLVPVEISLRGLQKLREAVFAVNVYVQSAEGANLRVTWDYEELTTGKANA